MPELKITEIFYSIQGESTWAGLPCAFVRLSGCPLRCRWCDTSYAFTEGTRMSEEAILEKVASFGCPMVEVTGGEPLAQPGCPRLLSRLADQGYQVLLETSGAISITEVDKRVRIIIDVKCPDSGEAERNRWENLELLRPQDEIKFVLASRRDYEWAREVVGSRGLSQGHAVLFSPVWEDLSPKLLSSWILEDRLPVRLQVQLHKILYGPETRGV